MACQKDKANNIQKHGDRYERFKQNLKAFNVITSRAVDKLNALTVSPLYTVINFNIRSSIS